MNKKECKEYERRVIESMDEDAVHIGMQPCVNKEFKMSTEIMLKVAEFRVGYKVV